MTLEEAYEKRRQESKVLVRLLFMLDDPTLTEATKPALYSVFSFSKHLICLFILCQ